jgi:hypothetical protein
MIKPGRIAALGSSLLEGAARQPPMRGVLKVSKLKSRLTYANVIATIALFLALGGGAFAAFKLPKKSVGTKNLKAKAVTEPKLGDKAVTEGKLGDGAVTAAKIAGGQVIKDITVREVVRANVANNSFAIDRPKCESGEFAIAGGGGFTVLGTRTYGNNDIETNMRTFAPIDANDDAATAGQNATGWLVSAQNLSGAARDFHSYVVCAKK